MPPAVGAPPRGSAIIFRLCIALSGLDGLVVIEKLALRRNLGRAAAGDGEMARAKCGG